MASWIYFAAKSLAELRSTLDLAILNKVISRTPRNTNGHFIAGVKDLRVGDDLFLACRGQDRHIAVKATIAEPGNPYEDTALDILCRNTDADTLELVEFLYPDNSSRTVIRLEEVEPFHFDLSDREFPMHTIQRLPDYLDYVVQNDPRPTEPHNANILPTDNRLSPRNSVAEENAISVLSSIFPYVGEFIIQHCLESCLPDLPKLFDCDEVVSVRRQCTLGFPEAKVSFDGSGTLDLALIPKTGDVIPVEVKLGTTALTPRSIEKLLAPCSLSTHQNARIAGKVPAALNQSFKQEVLDLIGDEPLKVLIDGQWRVLSTGWKMVLRQRFADSLKENRPKILQEHFQAISLESICDLVSDETFNSIVSEFFSNRDFARLWIR